MGNMEVWFCVCVCVYSSVKYKNWVLCKQIRNPTILRNNFRTEWQQRLDIGTEEDSIHQLDRPAQVTIFRLRTGHCQRLSHLHRLKISHSDECPCGTGPQTPNHILQSCPTFDDVRHQTWPSPVEARRKLWGPVETLRQTADFVLLIGLKIWHGRERRRRRNPTKISCQY